MAVTQFRTPQIRDSQITTAKVVNSAITTAKIADLNVTTGKLASDAVISTKIAADAVNARTINVDVAGSNITQEASGALALATAITVKTVDASGAITADSVTATTITATGALTADSVSATTITATGTLTGSTVAAIGNLTAGGDLDVSGAADVVGAFTANSVGATTITATKAITGSTIASNGNLTAGGTATVTGAITGSTVAATGNMTVGNKLTTKELIVTSKTWLQGTTTFIYATNLVVADNMIVLNTGVTGSNVVDIGITGDRGDSPDVAIYWDETGNKWVIDDGTGAKEIATVGAGAGQVVGEVKTAGVGTTLTSFSLSNTPTAGTLALYFNGQRWRGDGNDYTVSGTAVTLLAASLIGGQDVVLSDYNYV